MTEHKQLPDGIYLDLSFDDYLAQQRVSSGNVTDMMDSPSVFWAGSWMNPEREERVESQAMTLGRAYHCARLEPEEFHRRYVCDLTPEDPDLEGMEILTTSTEIGNALSDLGEAKMKKGEKVMDQAQRYMLALVEHDVPEKDWPLCWPLVYQQFLENDAHGREILSPKHMQEIERDAARLRANPEVEALISDGLAEVSILWTDEATGTRCKCRPDYLRPGAVTHLKTWDSRTIGKPANRAIADKFRYDGHYRTGWFYLMGLEQMDRLEVREPNGKLRQRVDHDTARVLNAQRWDTWFLYLRRSGIPDIRAREIMYFDLPKGVEENSAGASLSGFRKHQTVLGRKAQLEIEACLRSYQENVEIFGTDGAPWFGRDMIGRIEDDDYSDFWLESMDSPR